MNLITMAHFGEAQGVIQKMGLKKISPELYTGSDFSLLITGEGPFEAATATARVAELLKAKQITNLGIAGSLSDEFKIGDFVSIRSIYLVQNERPLFKTIQVNEAGSDLITSFERILDPKKALPLRGFGKLIDREAWGVGFAARKAGIPFSCYKVVSDNAGSIEACELVKEKAGEFSEILAQKFFELSPEVHVKELPIEIPGLYFTFSTQHQFRDYLNKLMIKNECSRDKVLESCQLATILSLEVSPKEKAKKLLSRMEELLDPLKSRIQVTKDQISNEFQNHGFRIEIDHQLENPKVKISFEAGTDADLEKAKEALSLLTLKKFSKLMQGEFDVE